MGSGRFDEERIGSLRKATRYPRNATDAPTASWVTLRFIQERLHFTAQGRQICFEDSPNHLIRDESVAMDQPVAEGNDPATGANPVGKVRVQAEGLIKGSPHDFELSLYADRRRASAE